MVDVFSKKKRSEVMGRIKSKNTIPEILLRSALHKLGYRYKLHVVALPGKPDIVFPKYRVAIQIRGCFWHGHICSDGHVPKSKREYWRPKLRNNKIRDTKNDRALRKFGWTVIVVWECRIMNETKRGSEVRRISRLLQSAFN